MFSQYWVAVRVAGHRVATMWRLIFQCGSLYFNAEVYISMAVMNRAQHFETRETIGGPIHTPDLLHITFR